MLTDNLPPLLQMDAEDSEFEESSLSAHNMYRYVHGVSPFKLDRKLSREARRQARYFAGNTFCLVEVLLRTCASLLLFMCSNHL